MIGSHSSVDIAADCEAVELTLPKAKLTQHRPGLTETHTHGLLSILNQPQAGASGSAQVDLPHCPDQISVMVPVVYALVQPGRPGEGLPPTLVSSVEPTPGNDASASAKPAKGWHQNVVPHLRKNAVRKLVRSLIPAASPVAWRDPRMIRLIQFCRKSENDIYETANSIKEYNLFLAKRIRNMTEQLDVRREERRRRVAQAAV